MLLEKTFESRHEQGGFGPALMNVFQHRDMPHVWANTICLTGALLFYNLLAEINRRLGTGGLARMFLSPSRDSTDS
jgi:ABC-type dipeptide/oligopeptide/nickel transport system permease component